MVLFLLSLAFCVLGCAYNYSVQQKRGEDIVPGIEYIHTAREFLQAVSKNRPSYSYSGGGRGAATETEGYQAL
jgi:hypothetical protein